MSDGGKGSRPRPYSVTQDQFAQNWDTIFRKKDEKDTNQANQASQSPESGDLDVSGLLQDSDRRRY